MGVEIKLTDSEFPASAAFIRFLQHYLNKQTIDTTWHDQLSETLITGSGEAEPRITRLPTDEILQHAAGRRALYRSYELLMAILAGRIDPITRFHRRYRFICVVGCPRHGGSYLTKQLFSAIGMDAVRVPNVIAHDGFPEAGPFVFEDQFNSLTVMMHNMAEYLAMVELYFADARSFDGFVVVPKKATKAAYHGAFFGAMLGPATEYVITVRHPVAACISTYEKSTGLPADGRFRVRSKIEEWARRDNVFCREDETTIFDCDYFDVYLRYWEHYHCALALTGLATTKRRTIVAYGDARMRQLAQGYFTRLGSAENAEEFRVFDKRDRHPEWRVRSEPVIQRVAAVWRTAGLAFPVEEIMECW